MPQNNPVIYLKGVQSLEMKSILQFMYLGQATFYQDRMNDFLNVAKSLEIKEISKDVECDQADSENNQECDAMVTDNRFEVETIRNSSNIAEDQEQIGTKLASKNEVGHFPCNMCDKQFAHFRNLFRHIKSAHEGLKFPCNDCEYKATTRQNLLRHLKSFHWNSFEFTHSWRDLVVETDCRTHEWF